MSTSTGARATSAAVGETDAFNITSFLTEDLIAYADSRPVDKKTRAALDDMIFDYIDGALDSEVANDLEALMRALPDVARFVADRSEERHLQNQLSMFFDGELDPDASAGIRRLIEDDPNVAKLARQIRQGGDYLRVVLQPVPGQHVDLDDVKVTRTELVEASDAAPTIARFSTLIAYASGIPVDKEIRGLLEDMIIRYVHGTLDHRSRLGLEASMRLAPNVARLITNETGKQARSSGSTMTFDRRGIEKTVLEQARARSSPIDSE